MSEEKKKSDAEEGSDAEDLMKLFETYLIPGVSDSIQFETKMPLDSAGNVKSVQLTARIEFDKLSEKGKKSALECGYSEGEAVALVISKSADYQGVDIKKISRGRK